MRASKLVLLSCVYLICCSAFGSDAFTKFVGKYAVNKRSNCTTDSYDPNFWDYACAVEFQIYSDPQTGNSIIEIDYDQVNKLTIRTFSKESQKVTAYYGYGDTTNYATWHESELRGTEYCGAGYNESLSFQSYQMAREDNGAFLFGGGKGYKRACGFSPITDQISTGMSVVLKPL